MADIAVTNPQVPLSPNLGLTDAQAAFEQEILGDLQENTDSYQWTTQGNYPPHALNVPRKDSKSPLKIFNIQALLQTKGMLPPTKISAQYSCLAPDPTARIHLDELASHNQSQRAPPGVNPNMLFGFNIGDRKNGDWFSDAVFAQQHFTGTNPTTITLAKDWVAAFAESAKSAKNTGMLDFLSRTAATSLYVQDYSYFRSAMRLSDKATLTSGGTKARYGCAPVALFHLGDEGRLHPLAIVIDYKGSMANSVVIFNKRLTPGSGNLAEEAQDWPWRYAKTCVQSADWLRHEVSIHLVNTHLVEEATIVAAHNAFPTNHIVYQLLEKHWDTTLSLNAAAREILVPQVIARIVGVKDTELSNFLNHAYSSFNWSDLYIPKDLTDRGFPHEELDKSPKYRNYAYARNMAHMWPAIRSFVARVLKKSYTNGDAQVAADPHVKAFCDQMRSPLCANMPSFPEITTLDELINTVTMCIHIASPQHTAVNYLQQYYQVFVPNKPWAMYTPLPTSLKVLQGYKEQQLLDALPFKHTEDWLIGSQLPYLLSFEVASQSSLLTYAQEARTKSPSQYIREEAPQFERALLDLQGVFKEHSQQLAIDDKDAKYMVMDPAITAVSVLI